MNKLKLIILAILLIFLNVNFLLSADWNYIGFSKMNNDEIFFVFIDKEFNSTKSNEIIVRQRHLFNNPQTLPTGLKYTSVELERRMNCKNKSILTHKAIFSSEDNTNIETYIANEEKTSQKISKNKDINSSIFEAFCKNKSKQ